MQQDINAIIEAVLSRLEAEHQSHAPSSSEDIPAEISARHVHLSREDLLELTGASDLVNSRSISQPGQFLSSLRVRLIGPKGLKALRAARAQASFCQSATCPAVDDGGNSVASVCLNSAIGRAR